jgi:hypothetical protein
MVGVVFFFLHCWLNRRRQKIAGLNVQADGTNYFTGRAVLVLLLLVEYSYLEYSSTLYLYTCTGTSTCVG